MQLWYVQDMRILETLSRSSRLWYNHLISYGCGEGRFVPCVAGEVRLGVDPAHQRGARRVLGSTYSYFTQPLIGLKKGGAVTKSILPEEGCIITFSTLLDVAHGGTHARVREEPCPYQ